MFKQDLQSEENGIKPYVCVRNGGSRACCRFYPFSYREYTTFEYKFPFNPEDEKEDEEVVSTNYFASLAEFVLGISYYCVLYQLLNISSWSKIYSGYAECTGKEKCYRLVVASEKGVLEAEVTGYHRRTIKQFANYMAVVVLKEYLTEDQVQQMLIYYTDLLSYDDNICEVQAENSHPQESVQGEEVLTGTKHSNTILTNSTGNTESIPLAIKDDTLSYASSEDLHQFDSLTERWMPLETITITTSQTSGTLLKEWYLPYDLLKSHIINPSLAPFMLFRYGALSIEMKFVVNAHKFQSGKALASIKYDPVGLTDFGDLLPTCLQREHVMLDLSTNNQGTLQIPFIYHRSFLHLNLQQDTEQTIVPSTYARVQLHILAKLLTGANQAVNMNIRPYYRFSKASFAGMEAVHTVQMDVDAVVKGMIPTKSLKAVLVGAEAFIDQLGKTRNQDKPTVTSSTQVIPKPRNQFASGKGIFGGTVLRLNPQVITSAVEVKQSTRTPRTVLEIAKVWGLKKIMAWTTTMKPDDHIDDIIVDLHHNFKSSNSRIESNVLTPVEYIASLYGFWSGTLECRLDFISNQFHTGAIMVSIQVSNQGTVFQEAACVYTKIFHLGDQKSVTFTIPYIYDTIWRRNTAQIYTPYTFEQDNRLPVDHIFTLGTNDFMRIQFYVVNELRAPDTVANVVQMLAYIRAGPSFMVHSLKPSHLEVTKDVALFRDMPMFNVPALAPTAYITTSAEKRVTLTKELTLDHTKIKFQMEGSLAENPDDTPDFNAGLNALHIQTLDSQVNIKDILRRPIQLTKAISFNKTEVTNHVSLFIPLMVPSHNMVYSDSYETIYADGVTLTPTAMLMNLFRFWRGSMRFTFVVEDSLSKNYTHWITHIPHSGVRKIGKIEFPKGPSLVGSSFASVPLVANVNATECVEVPYDTELNWTLCHSARNNEILSVRDQTDTNAGHIVFTPSCTCDVTVWWEAGDDFEYESFLGVPSTITRDRLHGVYETEIKFQAEASLYSKTLAKVNTIMNLPDQIADTLTNANNVGDAIISSSTKAEKLLVKGLEICDNASAMLENISPLIESLEEKIRESLKSFPGSIYDSTLFIQNGVEIIMDLVVAWLSKSWAVLGNIFVKAIAKLLGFSAVQTVLKYGTQIAAAIRNLVDPQIVVQAPSQTVTLLGVLCGLVGTVVGVSLEAQNYSRFIYKLSERFVTTGGIAYLNQVLRFVQSTFEVVRDLVMDALGYADPNVKALQMLSKDTGVISTFVKEANTILNEANASLLSDPGFRKRFWYTVSQAYQIQSILAVSPANVVSPIVTRLCTDVIKASSEKFMDLSCSPCRYEPFVICIEGEPGIGKSFMTETMVSELLGSIGFDRPSSGLIYTRPPGARFWSGYKNQPVVVYDDWMNLNDSDQILSQLSELYQMKSTSDFIPEMAHLEEKKIKANPLIVVLLCNGAFPSCIGQKAIYPDAIFRRRDLVLRASLKEEWIGKDLRDLTEKESMDCGHLLFQRYASAKVEGSLSTVQKTWSEVKPWLCATYKRYHQQETILVRKRIKKFQTQMRLNSENYLDYSDPFSLFYTSTIDIMEDTECNPNGWLPSEQLEAAVFKVVDLIKEKKDEVLEFHIDSKPENVFQNFPVGWESLSASLASGMVFSGGVMAQILDWTAQGVGAFMRPLLENTGQVIEHECMTCLEQMPCYYVCGGVRSHSNPDAHHYMCMDCMIRMKRANMGSHCPMCRVEPMLACLPKHLTRLYIVLRWVVVNIGDRLVWIFSFFRDFLRSRSMVNSRLLLSALSSLIAFLQGDAVTTAVAASYVGAGVVDAMYDPELFVDVARSWIFNPLNMLAPSEEYYTPQSEVGDTAVQCITTDVVANDVVCNDDQEMEKDPWDVLSPKEEAIMRCERNKKKANSALSVSKTELLNIQKKRASATPYCMHEGICDKLPYLEYRETESSERYWSYVHSKNNTHNWVKIPYFACQYENCPFADTRYLDTFVQDYMVEHEINLAALTQNIINAPREGKQYYINKLPPFLRAEWMLADSGLTDEELVKPFTWWEYLSEKWAHYKQFFFVIAGVVGGITALSSTYSMFASLLNLGSSTTIAPVVQVASNDAHIRHLRGQRDLRPLNRHSTRPYVQSDTTSVVDKYIARNYVSFQIYRDNVMIYQLSGVGLFNHWCLMPRHYVSRLREDASQGYTIKLVPALGRNGIKSHEATVYTFDAEDFKISSHTDAALFKVPASYPMFKDIRSFCSTDKDLSEHINSRGSIFLVPGSDGSVPRITDIDIFGRVNSAIISDDKEKFEIRDVLHYGYSQVGACGSLVRVEHHQRPIVAMHCAGSGQGTLGDGYGVLVTQEALGELMHLQVVTQCEDKDLGSLSEAKLLFGEEVNVHYLGTVPVEHIAHMPKKSKILPSLIHNQAGFECHTEPAILTSQDPRYQHEQSPLYYGAAKHGKKTIDFKSSIVNKAKRALWGGWISSMLPCVAQPKRLTYEQAVIGLPNVEYYDPMKLETSAGYPWTLEGKTTTKLEWLEIERDSQQRLSKCQLRAKLLAEVERKEKLRQKGIVPITMFVDTLKDERKSHAKVLKQGGTRVFCASPIDYTIATRQNLLHFSAAFMKARLNVMSAVGINAKGPEWAGLVRHLGRVNNNNIITMDYSNFGPGFNAEVARAASEIMIDWTMMHMEGANILELQALLKECTQSTHVCVNTVYQQTSGSPSGAAITVIINSLVNLLYILIAWDQLCGDTARLLNPDIYQVFREHVAVAVYGDDFIMSVSDDFKFLFNTITIQTFLSHNGIAATAMDKEKVATIPFQSLLKSEFLKRGFMPHPTREYEWLSPLSWEAVEDITQWVWKSADLREATRVNCESALLEAHGHGKEVFEKFKRNINKALIKRKTKTLTLDWFDLDRKFFEDDVGVRRTSYLFG
ncbi:hypothetical protein [Hubei picorna-like virus 39]|uniref:hypothetical protein n=1 Tax=Hubei picorna-like virus 39 TaxID=1923119 RepID=UPI00090B8B6A|nr:hypothetical protein [Hubei picorna-like virus 39]APG78039.1 hypothetical protein [Hubei picorna-like virus 39]